MTFPDSLAFEPSSFRDREATVFYREGRVYRALSKRALENFKLVSETEFFRRRVSAGEIVGSALLARDQIPPGIDSPGVIEHSRIPFISYSYEWSFRMLRDAALLQLDLIADALNENIQLKDCSSFNFQFCGARLQFIDIASFEPYLPGSPWLGYRQFCEMFLFPLLLASYKQINFHPLLRSNLEGIPAQEMYKLLSLRDFARRGIFAHVVLQKTLQDRVSDRPENIRTDLSRSGFNKELIGINVRKLRSLIVGLPLPYRHSEWVTYATQNSYDASDAERKKDFVRRALSAHHQTLVWDIGCNTGVFSKLAAAITGADVVAMDADVASIDVLYAELSGKLHKILPLVMNLTNPSPNQGWRGKERGDLRQRGRPSHILALALVHHVVIGANVPLAQFIEYLRSFDAELTIEFVTKDDPMCKKLLTNREDVFSDYVQEVFENTLRTHYSIAAQENLQSGTRALYHCVPRL